jgi:hypothetical protein
MGRCTFATALWFAAVVALVACGRHSEASAIPAAADAFAGEMPQPPENDATVPADGAPGGLDAGAPDGGIAFDLGADFSFASNPNGPWRYGYTVGPALDVEQFALDTLVPDAGGDPIAFWHPWSPATIADGYYPYVAENSGPVASAEEASWALYPQEVAMEASNSGQYSMVQFVAPFAGSYQIKAHFEGVHFRLSTTDVHVLAGDAGLFAANIDGYGGDPTFHVVEGASPTADYQGTVTLQAGDVLTFAVGYGTDMTDYNDTTGLTAHIVFVGN